MSRLTSSQSSFMIVFATPRLRGLFATNALGHFPGEKFRTPNRSRAFDDDANDITFTMDGLDDARRARVVADDLAQPADAHVDAAIERRRIAAARELDELQPRDDPVAVREQRRQHAIFRV